MDNLHTIDWATTLDQFRQAAHPAHETMLGHLGLNYYWSAFQTEWATDVMFESPEALHAIYPALVRGAIQGFDCRDVMRFLGRKQLTRFPSGEITSDYGERVEGMGTFRSDCMGTRRIVPSDCVVRIGYPIVFDCFGRTA